MESDKRKSNAFKHGAYSETMPRKLEYIQKWLKVDENAIIEDLGGIERVSAKQHLQIQNALRLLNILYFIDEYIRENPEYVSLDSDRLSAITNNYGYYINSLSRILQSLGLERKVNGNVESLDDYIENIKRKKPN
jgi:hypothetical protein